VEKRLPLNLLQLLNDHNVEYREGSRGWIQLPCPFCYKGDGVFGLGFNNGFTCFKCGKLRVWETIAALLDIGLSDAANICRKYEGDTKTTIHTLNAVQREITAVSTVKLPYSTAPMTKRHHNYLEQRNFDPDYLEAQWNLLGTGVVGEFKHRIIAPIYQDKELVCYQGRDITNKASAKYKSCHDEDAVIPIKSCLYGIDKCKDDWIIITEGVTKVWRLRTNATCTFGTAVTDAQLLRLSKFQRRYIFFDADEAGREGADNLAGRLSVLSGRTEICLVPGIDDVADIPQEDVNEIVKDIRMWF